MKNNKVLALALSAGLVVAGFNTAHAAESNDPEAERIRQGFQDQVDELAEANARKKYQDQVDELIKENELKKAKEEAKQALKDAGITSDFYANLIDKASSVDGVNALRDETIESHKKSQVDPGKKVTIDEWNLNNAKEEAKQALKDAGVTSDLYAKQIDKANTIEGVNALRDEIIESHKRSQVDPGKKVTIDEWNLNNAKENLHNIIRAANDEGFISLSQALEFESELDAATTEAEIENLFERVISATKREALDSLEAHKEAAAAIINDLYDQGKISLADAIDYTLQIGAAKDEAAVEEILNQIFAGKPELEEDDDLEVEKIKASNSIKWLNDNGFISIAQALEFEAEIEKATTKAQLDEIVEKAMNTRSDLLTDLSKTQLAADDIIDDLRRSGRITDEQARGFYDRIDRAKTSEEIQKILKDAFAIRNKKSIPWTDLTPAKPIKKPCNDWVFPFPLPFPIEGAEIVVPAPEKPAPDNIAPIGPGPVIPTPVTPAPEKPVEENDDKNENIDVDSIIKDIDERNKEILDEMAKIDTTITDENKKPADEDKKPVDEDKKPSDDEKQPSKEKEVVVKEVVKVPAKAHSNPKTGVADLSAVAGTLAISMAGIVATRKKND